RDAGEERGFGQRQLRGAVPEVCARGPFDSVGAVPEIDRVEVRSEDPVLRPLLFQLPCERGLLQLPCDRALVAGERVLDELLRDRRAALHRPAAHVVPERARHAANVDAAVLVEALVLHRDDRLLDPGRDGVRGHEDTALRPAQHGEDRVAVAGVDVAVHLLVLVAERVEPAQLLADREDDAVRKGRQAEEAEDGDERQKTELADPAPGMSLHRHERRDCSLAAWRPAPTEPGHPGSTRTWWRERGTGVSPTWTCAATESAGRRRARRRGAAWPSSTPRAGISRRPGRTPAPVSTNTAAARSGTTATMSSTRSSRTAACTGTGRRSHR